MPNKYSAALRRLILVGAVICVTSPSRAQSVNSASSTNTQASAPIHSLYQQALADFDAHRYEEARAKLEEVLRLEPDALGARLTLGQCFEGLDRLATAWAHYSFVAAKAATLGQVQRARKAQSFADALEPKLARLTIVVPPEVESIPGLQITRDGETIGQAQWNVAVPVDVGTHEIVAISSGYDTLSLKLEVGQNGKMYHIDVRMLKRPTGAVVNHAKPISPAAVSPKSAAGSATSSESKSSPKTPGWVWAVGGIGLAAAGGSVYFLVDYASVQRRVTDTCPNNLCSRVVHTEESVHALNTQWNRDVGLAIGLGAVGVAGISTALVGIASGKSNSNRVGIVPFFAPTRSGMALHGTF